MAVRLRPAEDGKVTDMQRAQNRAMYTICNTNDLWQWQEGYHSRTAFSVMCGEDKNHIKLDQTSSTGCKI
jgi:hypothetical protein